jgi:hypothetical protein
LSTLLLTTGSGNSPAAKASLPEPGGSQKAYKPIQLVFPNITGFQREPQKNFEDAALGYSVSYTSPEVTVSVFVYNGGHAKIADGVSSSLVKAELESARARFSRCKTRVNIAPLQSAFVMKSGSANRPKPRKPCTSLSPMSEKMGRSFPIST